MVYGSKTSIHGCDQFGCHWKNFTDKAPPFKFPTLHPVTTSSVISEMTIPTENITSTTTNLFTDTADTNNTMGNKISDVLKATFSDILKLEPPTQATFQENVTSSNNIVTGIEEVTSASSFTDVIQNGTFSIETAQNGSTDGNETILSTVTQGIVSITQNGLSGISTTTQKAITFAKENISFTNIENTENTNHAMHHNYSYSDDRYWLYIILGIIIGILMIIGVLLLLIYIRYKKISIHPFYNYYTVCPMKETSNNNQEEHNNSFQRNTYVQYSC